MEDEGDDDEPDEDSGSASVALPLAAVTKLIKDTLPTDMRPSPDVAPLLQDYLGQFLEAITSSANEQATKHKKLLSEAHVHEALKCLGCGDYFPSSTETADGDVAERAKKKQKKAKRSGLPPGMTEEESLRLQQELFASARALVQSSEDLSVKRT
mmetsp:Transcript_16885/g.43350  ORF Transcript_16885/g.43350 Transcript_16885/m.43350 type:complete len:155 (+) Transcript_16885:31-495(+)